MMIASDSIPLYISSRTGRSSYFVIDGIQADLLGVGVMLVGIGFALMAIRILFGDDKKRPIEAVAAGTMLLGLCTFLGGQFWEMGTKGGTPKTTVHSVPVPEPRPDQQFRAYIPDGKGGYRPSWE